MHIRDMIPWNRNTQPVPSFSRERDPFMALHREVNRLFDDAFRSFGTVSPLANGAGWPSVEVGETDKEVRVTAELPGMNEKDLDVSLTEGVLTIRGERKEESRDGERRASELYYGRFERRIPIDWDVNPDDVKASFKNGVLQVTIPKSERAQAEAKRIPISSK